MSIHEHQARARQVGEGKILERFRRQAFRVGFKYRLERQFHDGGDIRETPILMLQRREAKFYKTRHSPLAERQHPGGLFCFTLKVAEVLQVSIR